jgi:hypothetical protein
MITKVSANAFWAIVATAYQYMQTAGRNIVLFTYPVTGRNVCSKTI